MLSDLSFDFLVRLDGTWFGHHHPSPHILSLQPTDQSAQVVSCLCPIQGLVEHLDTWTQQGGQWDELPVLKLLLLPRHFLPHSPVTTDLKLRLWPTNSASSPFLMIPLSIVPVTTVPLPEIPKK